MGAFHPQPYRRVEYWRPQDPGTQAALGKYGKKRLKSSPSSGEDSRGSEKAECSTGGWVGDVHAALARLADFHTGRVRQAPFGDWAKECGVAPVLHRRLWELFGGGRDGAGIRAADVARALDGLVAGPRRGTVLCSIFETFDIDRSGTVTVHELARLREKMEFGGPFHMPGGLLVESWLPSATMLDVAEAITSAHEGERMDLADFTRAVDTEPDLLRAFLPHILTACAAGAGGDVRSVRVRTGLHKRFRYDAALNTVFISWQGLRFTSEQQIQEAKVMLNDEFERIGRWVDVVVDKTDCHIDEALCPAWRAMVALMQSKYARPATIVRNPLAGQHASGDLGLARRSSFIQRSDSRRVSGVRTGVSRPM